MASQRAFYVVALAVTGCDAFGVTARTRTVLMHHGPEPHAEPATAKGSTDVSFAAEEAARLLADEEAAAAKAKWLAARRDYLATPTDDQVTKWARDEAAKSVVDFLQARAANEKAEMALANDDAVAKAELMNVANSVASLGLAVSKAAVHTTAAITLETGKMVAGAAGNAMMAPVIKLGENVKATPGRAVEHVKGAPGRAAAHVKDEMVAVPGKAAQALRARLHEFGETVRAVPGQALEHVKAEVVAVPGKVLKGVERSAEAKAERLKLHARDAAMLRIDRLFNKKNDDE